MLLILPYLAILYMLFYLAILHRPFYLLAPKEFSIIWLSYILTINVLVLDKGFFQKRVVLTKLDIYVCIYRLQHLRYFIYNLFCLFVSITLPFCVQSILERRPIVVEKIILSVIYLHVLVLMHYCECHDCMIAQNSYSVLRADSLTVIWPTCSLPRE